MIKYLKDMFVFCVTAFLFLASCIKDGLNECPTYKRVKVVFGTSAGIDIPKDTEIKNVDLFIFNAEESLIRKLDNISMDQWIDIDYPNRGPLRIVAIANVSDEDLIVGDIQDCQLSGSAFALRESHQIDGRLLYNAPGEVFQGNIMMNNAPLLIEEYELPVLPVVSKINIKVKGHQQYASQLLGLAELPRDEDFTFVVSTRHISVDYMGNPCNSPVDYCGKNILSYDGICEVETFNMFSTSAGEDAVIYIYHADKLVDTISEIAYQSRSMNKSALTLRNGQLLEVYINYQSGLSVGLENTNWLEGGLMWKDF